MYRMQATLVIWALCPLLGRGLGAEGGDGAHWPPPCHMECGSAAYGQAKIILTVCVSPPEGDVCHVDLSSLELAAPGGGDTPYEHRFILLCNNSGAPDARMQVRLTNSRARQERAAVGFLVTNCRLRWHDVAEYGRLVDLRVLELHNWQEVMDAELAGPAAQDNNSEIGTLPVGLENVNSLTFFNHRGHDDTPLPLPTIFTKFRWGRMAEITLVNTSVNVSELRTSMPVLQAMDLSGCHVDSVRGFPWQPEPEVLPQIGVHYDLTLFWLLLLAWKGEGHEQYGRKFDVEVKDHLFPRILRVDRNSVIRSREKYQFRGLIQRIDLIGCDVTSLDPEMFRYTEGLNYVDLSYNRLELLPEGIFSNLSELLHLILGHNLLTSLQPTVFHGMTSLKTLNLTGNRLTLLQPTVFHGLTSLQTLSVTGNRLTLIPADVFTVLTSLEILMLDNNTISHVSDQALHFQTSSLTSLSLADNNLTTLPVWTFLVRHLTEADFSGNRITSDGLGQVIDKLDPSQVVYQNRESSGRHEEHPVALHHKRIRLSDNHVTALPPLQGNLTCGCSALLVVLSYFRLTLDGNPLRCDCAAFPLYEYVRAHPDVGPGHWAEYAREIGPCGWPPESAGLFLMDAAPTAFKCLKAMYRCPTGCECYRQIATDAVEVNCQGQARTSLPPHLPAHNEELDISQNDIRVLDTGRYYMRRLKYLNVSHNVISELTYSELRHDVWGIDTVDLRYNKLEALPDIKLSDRSKVYLSHNYYLCDCHMRWAIKWLRDNRDAIPDVDSIECTNAAEPEVIGQPIVYADPDDFVCQTPAEERWVNAVAISLGVVLVLLLVIGVPVYVKRGEIKLLLYVHFRWHPFDRSDDAVTDKRYDAFVSYSGLDYRWVIGELMRMLESRDPPFRLCLHDRDFQVGAPIEENIMKSVKESRRMIMVLSRNFLTSDWCLLEFRAAHHRVLKDRSNYLIVILLSDVSMDDLDDDLKLYMKTNTYLSVENKHFSDKLLYALPQTPVTSLVPSMTSRQGGESSVPDCTSNSSNTCSESENYSSANSVTRL